MEVTQCNQPSTKRLADVLWEWWHIMDSVLASMLVGLALSNEWSQTDLCEQSPCCWFHVKPLLLPQCHPHLLGNGWNGWVKGLTNICSMNHLVHLVINTDLCWRRSFVNKHTEHKYIYTLCPFWRVLSMYYFWTAWHNHWIVLFPSLWLSNQTISHYLWISTEPRTWPFFLGKMENRMPCFSTARAARCSNDTLSLEGILRRDKSRWPWGLISSPFLDT